MADENAKSPSDDRLAVGVAILEIILKYGVPLALQMIAALETDNPTSEDIRALLIRVPHPDEYEKKAEG